MLVEFSGFNDKVIVREVRIKLFSSLDNCEKAVSNANCTESHSVLFSVYFIFRYIPVYPEHQLAQ